MPDIFFVGYRFSDIACVQHAAEEVNGSTACCLQAFEKAGKPLDHALVLEAPSSTLEERLSGRRFHSSSGTKMAAPLSLMAGAFAFC